MDPQEMVKRFYRGEKDLNPTEQMLGEKPDGGGDMICGDCDCYD